MEGAIKYTYNTYKPLTLKIKFKKQWVTRGGDKRPRGYIGNWVEVLELKTVIIQYATTKPQSLENNKTQMPDSSNLNNPIPILIIGTPETFGLIFYYAIDTPKTTQEPFAAIKKDECAALINQYKQQKNCIFTIKDQPNIYSIAHIIEKNCSDMKRNDFIQEIPATAENNLDPLETIKFPLLQSNENSTQFNTELNTQTDNSVFKSNETPNTQQNKTYFEKLYQTINSYDKTKILLATLCIILLYRQWCISVMIIF